MLYGGLFIGSKNYLNPKSHTALRQYTTPSSTLSPHREQDNRGIVASPGNVAPSIDIGTHQRSYADNDRQRHTQANLYCVSATVF